MVPVGIIDSLLLLRGTQTAFSRMGHHLAWMARGTRIRCTRVWNTIVCVGHIAGRRWRWRRTSHWWGWGWRSRGSFKRAFAALGMIWHKSIRCRHVKVTAGTCRRPRRDIDPSVSYTAVTTGDAPGLTFCFVQNALSSMILVVGLVIVLTDTLEAVDKFSRRKSK